MAPWYRLEPNLAAQIGVNSEIVWRQWALEGRVEPKVKRDPYRLVGTVLGRYQILQLIGIGGMGAVYRATHSIIQDHVALKVLKPDLALENEDMVQYFFKEARNTRRLNHPNIVRVTDADVADGTAFLVMEWLEGRTLEEELKEQGVITLDRLAMLLEQICEGLTHAHTTGIIHRDLKPSNIMIVKDYRGVDAVKILDFGIAKALNSTIGTASSRLIGAPYYSSPEQMTLGAEIDVRADIYSIGVMLYQLATGKLPFDADTVERLIQQHIQTPPPSLCEIRPDISAEVEKVVFKALAKRPEDRHQSAAELASEFRAATDLKVGHIELECADSFSRELVPEASVYLDNNFVGHTDMNGRWRRSLLSRELAIEIRHDRYQAWRENVNVVAGEEVKVAAQLVRKELGELMIWTDVEGSGAPIAGAQVLIGGKAVGVTDENGCLHLQNLAPGEIKVEVVHPDRHYVYAKDVQILKWQQSSWRVTLPAPSSRNAHNGKKTWPMKWIAIGVLGLVAVFVAIGGGIVLIKWLRSRVPSVSPVAASTPTPQVENLPTVISTPAPPKVEGREIVGNKINDLEFYQLALSADGKLMAQVGDKEPVAVWRVESDRTTPLPALTNALTGGCVAISRSSELVASGGTDFTVRVWRIADRSQPQILRGHKTHVHMVMFSLDEQSLISGDVDGTIIQWRISDGTQLKKLVRPNELVRAVDPARMTLALISNKSSVLWSLTEEKPVAKLADQDYKVTSGAFSSNGEIVALGSNDGIIRLWNRDGSFIRSLSGESKGDVGSVAFSQDGKIIAAGLSDGTIQLWRVADGESLTQLKHNKIVYSLSFGNRASLLASEGDDQTIRVWRISNTE